MKRAACAKWRESHCPNRYSRPEFRASKYMKCNVCCNCDVVTCQGDTINLIACILLADEILSFCTYEWKWFGNFGLDQVLECNPHVL